MLVKDILYRSKRFRMAMLGEEMASRTYTEPEDACLDALPETHVFHKYPKLAGNLSNEAAAQLHGSLFRTLPTSIKRHIILYV